MKPGVHSHRRR